MNASRCRLLSHADRVQYSLGNDRGKSSPLVPSSGRSDGGRVACTTRTGEGPTRIEAGELGSAKYSRPVRDRRTNAGVIRPLGRLSKVHSALATPRNRSTVSHIHLQDSAKNLGRLGLVIFLIDKMALVENNDHG